VQFRTVQGRLAMPPAVTDMIANAIDHARNQVAAQAAGQSDPVGRRGESHENTVDNILGRSSSIVHAR
jgi:hypothetical protein